MLIRAQEIVRYVEDAVFDAGLTGKDWIVQPGADVVEVVDLVYAKRTRQPFRWDDKFENTLNTYQPFSLQVSHLNIPITASRTVGQETEPGAMSS